MDSYIGKLRSIFAKAGRQGDWNHTLLLGDPATDDLVKIYLKQITAEQLQARVIPKQAVPFFPDKLLLLSDQLKRRLALPTLNASEQFVTARDQAFFKTLSLDEKTDLPMFAKGANMVNLELQICITFALSAKLWANTYVS